MRQKKLISLEQLEYQVYKNENEIRIKKIITLDDIFNIRIIPKADNPLI
jgi:hypothetical protein